MSIILNGIFQQNFVRCGKIKQEIQYWNCISRKNNNRILMLIVLVGINTGFTHKSSTTHISIKTWWKKIPTTKFQIEIVITYILTGACNWNCEYACLRIANSKTGFTGTNFTVLDGEGFLLALPLGAQSECGVWWNWWRCWGFDHVFLSCALRVPVPQSPDQIMLMLT